MKELDDFKTATVVSTDGASIGYRRIGVGPGVILVHGALQSSLSFTKLAKALSADFTVYVVDRRGRSLSGPYSDADNLDTESTDILSIARHTGARYIFGLSSGAIITLHAALSGPVFDKVALYEPPIPTRGMSFARLRAEYSAAMAKGSLGGAFVAILKGTGDTSFFTRIPSFILSPIMNMMIRAERKSARAGETILADLIPTFFHDGIVVRDSPSLIARARDLEADVLLMGGSKSQTYLKDTLGELRLAIPAARTVTFENQGHLAADNSGDPGKVAKELAAFFRTSDNS